MTPGFMTADNSIYIHEGNGQYARVQQGDAGTAVATVFIAPEDVAKAKRKPDGKDLPFIMAADGNDLMLVEPGDDLSAYGAHKIFVAHFDKKRFIESFVACADRRAGEGVAFPYSGLLVYGADIVPHNTAYRDIDPGIQDRAMPARLEPVLGQHPVQLGFQGDGTLHTGNAITKIYGSDRAMLADLLHMGADVLRQSRVQTEMLDRLLREVRDIRSELNALSDAERPAGAPRAGASQHRYQ